MKREIKITADGSKTLYINDLTEGYHSLHGALQEAEHVFIKNGMNLINNYEINILEMGFGTGLNALATIDAFLKKHENQKVNYFTLEKYPIGPEEIENLSYHTHFKFKDANQIYNLMHQSEWEKTHELLPNFFFTKYHCDFFDLKKIDLPPIHLVYYDCFGARVQPDLWEKPLFEMVRNKMMPGGLITTYSSKGSVRRVLLELNFNVIKREGPKGKREMINAFLK